MGVVSREAAQQGVVPTPACAKVAAAAAAGITAASGYALPPSKRRARRSSSCMALPPRTSSTLVSSSSATTAASTSSGSGCSSPLCSDNATVQSHGSSCATSRTQRILSLLHLQQRRGNNNSNNNNTAAAAAAAFHGGLGHHAASADATEDDEAATTDGGCCTPTWPAAAAQHHHRVPTPPVALATLSPPAAAVAAAAAALETTSSSSSSSSMASGVSVASASARAPPKPRRLFLDQYKNYTDYCQSECARARISARAVEAEAEEVAAEAEAAAAEAAAAAGAEEADESRADDARDARLDVLADVLDVLMRRAMRSSGGVPKVGDVYVQNVQAPPMTMANMLRRLTKYAGCTYNTFLCAGIYVDRVSRRITLTPGNIQAVFLACCILALKWLDDQGFTNNHYARCAGVPQPDFNNLELTVLFELEWDLHVNKETFESYDKVLRTHRLWPSDDAGAADSKMNEKNNEEATNKEDHHQEEQVN